MQPVGDERRRADLAADPDPVPGDQLIAGEPDQRRCLRGSPGARAYYQALRARGIGHQAALRQLSNRLVGILHGCLASRTLYNEHTAWDHQQQSAA